MFLTATSWIYSVKRIHGAMSLYNPFKEISALDVHPRWHPFSSNAQNLMVYI
jgi:hypothetical protein